MDGAILVCSAGAIEQLTSVQCVVAERLLRDFTPAGCHLLRQHYFEVSGDTAKLPGPRSHVIRLYLWPGHAGIVGGAKANGHPRRLDREIFADCPSAKIGSLENFQLLITLLNFTSRVQMQ